MDKNKVIKFTIFAAVLDLFTLVILCIDIWGGGIQKSWLYGVIVMHSIASRQLMDILSDKLTKNKEDGKNTIG